jgi:fumarate reductase flavoprotein subunit
MAGPDLALPTTAVVALEPDMTSATDIVIIGAGAAGFAAALTAADAGADVLLLEKAAEPGGSSRICGGLLAFAGTDLQQRNGIEDSSDLLFQDLREVGRNENDPALVRAYADNQLATYEWLCRLGVQFGPRPDASSGQSVPRCHVIDPDAMIQVLAGHAHAHPRITVQTKTAATRLLRGSGGVAGVRVQHDGIINEIDARRGVVLTSGGFTRNAELIRTFVPKQAKAWVSGGEANTGDGLLMAWQLGAGVRDVAYIQGTYGKHPTNHSTRHSLLSVYKGAIAVNLAGRRFVDESLSYKLLGTASLEQAGDYTWQIFDQPIYDAHEEDVSIFDVRHRHRDGMLVVADTLEGLAIQMGLDAATVTDSVSRYNRYVQTGVDPEFGRRHLVHNHGTLVPIATPPFYAHPSTAALYGTYCGITVDPTMQVLDVFGEPIFGLRAAGEVISGLHGAAYMTGSALGKALIFGRIAGDAAARDNRGSWA